MPIRYLGQPLQPLLPCAVQDHRSIHRLFELRAIAMIREFRKLEMSGPFPPSSRRLLALLAAARRSGR